jgi:hypothetical protein
MALIGHTKKNFQKRLMAIFGARKDYAGFPPRVAKFAIVQCFLADHAADFSCALSNEQSSILPWVSIICEFVSWKCFHSFQLITFAKTVKIHPAPARHGCANPQFVANCLCVRTKKSLSTTCHQLTSTMHLLVRARACYFANYHLLCYSWS